MAGRPILNARPHVYTSTGFDRAAERRKDKGFLETARTRPTTRVVLMHGLSIFAGEEDEGRLRTNVMLADLGDGLSEQACFLGLHEGEAVFSLDLEEPPRLPGRFVELRALAPVLSHADAGLLAYARALAHWHATHRFCGRCGRRTDFAEAGHARHCEACKVDVFPRTDPAVIVLVTSGEHCILGRSPRFPPGMYSTLAGFVEPAESLESTLAREVFEEVGVRVTDIVYRSSQPWPFPQSLMLGFRATATTTQIVIDPDEIEDAQWFERAVLLDEVRRPVKLPAADSIARFLIEEWLAEA